MYQSVTHVWTQLQCSYDGQLFLGGNSKQNLILYQLNRAVAWCIWQSAETANLIFNLHFLSCTTKLGH